MARYLTKSRFKLALSCPAKLYYTRKPQYPDTSRDDPFLEALAEGGYQVGALAKCYYPGGIEIMELDYDESLQQTNELLQREENVIIFEAAFRYKNLFIRADIIEKKVNRINLIEVKAKSFSGNDSNDMLSNKGFLNPKWEIYLYDVAFQKYVITRAFPEFDVHAFLMLANKKAVATVTGLNQKFRLKTVENERNIVETAGDVSRKSLGKELLIRVDVNDLISRIYEGTDKKQPDPVKFIDRIHYYAEKYEQDEIIITPLHKDCKKCEFHATPEQEREGKLSGFKECWKQQLGWNDAMFRLPLVLDIWDYRSKQKLMDNGKYLMKDVKKDDIGEIKSEPDGSLSRTERQWLQVRKMANNDNEPYIDTEGLRKEFNTFIFPLHFIDFETSMVSIPFFAGRRPYEQTAFQFSHHIIYENLTIEHKGQYLCREKGKFPNIDFIRNLKAELDKDQGTIFRFADHENTVLKQILAQLQDYGDIDPGEKNDLIRFIQTVTHGDNYRGERDMVDLLKLVKKYYYHPLMGGSNSIKDVLPAVLASSEYLQNKYSQPVYGKNSLIKSLNFEDGWRWIQWENGSIVNPYKLLPGLFEGIDTDQIEEFLLRNDITDGGAAMTAYAKLQFTRITNDEEELISEGLLKYCELDTLAMVMIWEYWNNLIKIN